MSTPYFGKLEIQNVSFVSLMPTKENQIEFNKLSSFSNTIVFEKIVALSEPHRREVKNDYSEAPLHFVVIRAIMCHLLQDMDNRLL